MKKKLFYIFLILFFLSSCGDEIKDYYKIYNSRRCEYKNIEDKWKRCPFPESILNTLRRDTVFNSFFFKIPEIPENLIDTTAWEYRVNFQIDDDILSGRYELVFNGIVGMAEIYLNDAKIAESSDMFITKKIDVTDLVKKGQNTFFIKFKSYNYWKNFYSKQANLPLKGREMMRMPYYYTAKELGIAYVPIGFQGIFQIVNWKKAVIRNVHHTLSLLKPNSIAKIKTNVEVEAVKNTDAIISISYKNKVLVSKNIEINKGMNNIPIEFEIKNPKLWWTYDLGDPFLYKFVTTLKIDKKTVSKKITDFGIREIEIDTTGHNFVLRLNGLPVTLKIINYIRPELFNENLKKQDFQSYVNDFVKAGINTVHIDERGMYEDDEFYKQCDRQGVLVWQDFMFPFKYFENKPGFMQTLKKETEQQVRRIAGHTSIAFWSGEFFPTRYYEKYRDLFVNNKIDSITVVKNNADFFRKTLPSILHNYDSSAYYFDKMDFKSIIYVTDHFPEYPHINTYRSFTSVKDRAIGSEVNQFHSRPDTADFILQKQIKMTYGYKPNDITQQVYLSNLFKREYYEQKLLNSRYGLYTGYICGNYRDFSPMITNSSVDYQGFWKGKMFAIKNTMSDILIDITQNEGWIEIGVKSEKLNDINADFYFVLYDMNGKSLWRRNALNVKVYKNSYMKYFNFNLSKELSIIGLQNAIFMVQIYSEEEMVAEKIYIFTKASKLHLKPPTITKKFYRVDDGYVIELNTDYFAYGVCLFTGKKGILSDNYFMLIPGQPKKVKFYTNTEIYDIASSFKTIDFTQIKGLSLYNF